ncbi:putative nucleoside-diphosphate-sugar epimerase [Xylaria sp. FL0064]|nr:putative nucleoside-diphosphate-sugar epimerase [Xylaria sp. FL0064]
MRILTTGGAGFIGQIVSKELLADDSNELILVDVIEPTVPPGSKHPQNAKMIKVDLAESAAGVVTEADIPTPELSYGCQKIICETFINDYTRRGLINGFSLRFPTISIRPGKPSAAVTSFLSGIIREPLNGEVCALPLKDRAWRHWMCSPKTLVYNILVALKLPRDALAPHRRGVNMPGFAVTVQDMLDALEHFGGKDKLTLVHEEEVPELRTVLYSWADDFDNKLGLSLGMKRDTSFKNSVRDYIETLAESR